MRLIHRMYPYSPWMKFKYTDGKLKESGECVTEREEECKKCEEKSSRQTTSKPQHGKIGNCIMCNRNGSVSLSSSSLLMQCVAIVVDAFVFVSLCQFSLVPQLVVDVCYRIHSSFLHPSPF